MKAQFIDLGRNKVNKTIDVKDTKQLHREIGKHILAKGWGMEQTEDEMVYTISSGWNIVGTVKIIEE